MDERNEEKGFKVVDKRAMSDEEREAGRKASVPATPPASSGGAVDEGGGRLPGADPADSLAGIDAQDPRIAPPGFLDLLQSLQFSAMHHLGMIQGQDGNPSSVDLPAAQDAIDMMGMLKEKTKGNLTAEEDGVLTEGLYVLRMSYLAALNAGKAKP